MSFISLNSSPSGGATTSRRNRHKHTPSKTVGPQGNPETSRICIIGEAPGRTEVNTGQPFQGEAGRILDMILHNAGIIRAQNYITNYIKEFVPKGSMKRFMSDRGTMTEAGMYWREELRHELESVKADIIITLGKYSTAALTGNADITKRRGYLTRSLPDFGSRWVMPTIHPASCLYGGNYINRYYIEHDFKKAIALLNKGLRCDSLDDSIFTNTHAIFPTTITEVEEAIEDIISAGIMSFDIEVSNYEVSCFGMACDPLTAYTIPLNVQNLWTPEEELVIWDMLADILESPHIKKVGQNLIFDIHFLMTHQHIFVRGAIYDTMIAHHIIYPDFLKGLDFLASIYTNRRYWKDMVKFKNPKKDS